MNPESNAPEVPINNPQQVTSMSKYLTAVLYVTLPFLGGWIGYTMAPDRVVEVEVTTEKIVEVDREVAAEQMEEPKQEIVTETVDEKVRYGAFVDVNPLDYPINNQQFLASLPATSSLRSAGRVYSAVQARKITENLSLVVVDDGLASHSYDGVVLFDENTKQMISRVVYSFSALEKWISPSVRITVQNGASYANQIVLDDYANQKSIVLYEETDPNVQLADVCEMTCGGILYKTVDGQIVFARHEKIKGTTATRLIETVTVPVPPEYLPEGFNEYLKAGL